MSFFTSTIDLGNRPHESGATGWSNRKYHLTFDIDWAPDFCVAEILRLLDSKKIKGTFFVTHPSDVVSDLISSGHNVGLHPNFLPGSSHGNSVEAVIEYLLKIAPNADAIRTHALFQSTPLMCEIFKKYPQLKYDFSSFMYAFPIIKPFDWPFEGVKFKRINYNWEDDAAFFDPGFDWNAPSFYGDVTVFDFHPIHIGLNSKDPMNYAALKTATLGQPLWSATLGAIKSAANPGFGANTFLNALVSSDAQSIDFYELL